MNQVVVLALRQAGWRPNRVSSTREIRGQLGAAGYGRNEAGVRVLQEFDGLDVLLPSPRPDLLPSYNIHFGMDVPLNSTDPEEVDVYEEVLRTVLTPVAEYSHMCIYVAGDGSVWGSYWPLYGCLGPSVEDFLSTWATTWPLRQLDRTVEETVG